MHTRPIELQVLPHAVFDDLVDHNPLYKVLLTKVGNERIKMSRNVQGTKKVKGVKRTRVGSEAIKEHYERYDSTANTLDINTIVHR